MKKNFFIILFNFIYSIIYFSFTFFLIQKQNDSVLKGYTVVLILLFSILLIGTIISKILFNFRIEKNNLRKININNFNKNNIKTSIISSLIILFVIYSTVYLLMYFKSFYFFSVFSFSPGITNSCTYIVKILLVSLPLYTFEITYLEYCLFLNSIQSVIKIKFLKILLYFIFELSLLLLFKFNGFLYGKLTIDIFFFAYYIIKLRKIIKLCNMKN